MSSTTDTEPIREPGRLILGDSTAEDGVVAYRLGRIAEHLPIAGRWLDCGCADGYYAAGLVEAGATEVVGTDIAPDRVEEAVRIWADEPRLSFVDQPVDTLPFPDDHFDAALLNEVLEHVADQDAILGEIRRVLRPGGTLVVFSPNRWFPFEGHGARIGPVTIDAPTPIVPWLPARLTSSWLNARNYWPRQLAGVVARNGFDVQVVDFALPLLTKYRWLPDRMAAAYRKALPSLGRSRAIRRFGVSTMVVARTP
jgi:ubiquinone/menaquinone biosynthesis C-methylase UbiE